MNFSRVAKITVGKPGDGRKEISNLRVTFDIEKDLTKETNKSQISIYNLSDETLKIVENPDSVILLDAGYKDSFGRVFEGAITFVSSRGETDIETEIEAADGHLEIRDSIFSKSYGPGISSQVILFDIVSSMGATMQISTDIEHKEYPNGFAYAGKSKGAIEKVCNYIGAKWSIQNRIIQVRKAGGAISPKAFLISSETGMIGSPERIVKTQTIKLSEEDKNKNTKKKRGRKKKTEKEKKTGWKIKSLLLASVNPGSVIEVRSKYVKGFFVVDRVNHKGDTHGDDWYTEMEVFE